MKEVTQKLNRVTHDPRTGTLFISLRPNSHRRPQSLLEYPGRVILDLDAEGDIYGIRLLAVLPDDVERILKRLKAQAAEPSEGQPAGPDEPESA